jgi:hypothetical protein
MWNHLSSICVCPPFTYRGFAVPKNRPVSSEQLTVVDSYLSPEDCRAKALDCLIKADALDDPQEKAAMFQYAEWWNRLAELAQKRQDQHS